MPYQQNIIIEKRVLLSHFIGHFTIKEFAQCSQEIVSFLDTVPDNQLGIALFDASQVRTMPSNVFEIRKATSAYMGHPKHGISIPYGIHMAEQAVLRYITDIGAILFSQKLKMLRDEAEAVQFVISKYPDLAHSLPEALKAYQLRKITSL